MTDKRSDPTRVTRRRLLAGAGTLGVGVVAGAAPVCTTMLTDQQILQQELAQTSFRLLDLSTDATSMLNAAVTAKLSGMDEQYAQLDPVMLQGNIDGAEEIATLLQPYLQQSRPTEAAVIAQRMAAVNAQLAPLHASPGADGTGFVSDGQVTTSQRRAIATAVSAFAEAMSQILAAGSS